MSLTIEEALCMKRKAEREIARVLEEFQQKTGLTVSGVSHYVADSINQPPKVLRATVHVELK